MWNASQHTDDENTLWCWLRAVEWGRLPLFTSQLLAPPLLIFLPWQNIVLFFFLANILWALIRYDFINTEIAYIIASLMILKWPVTIISTIYLAWYQQNIAIATLALTWPLTVIILGIVTPTNVGQIQKVMMCQLGYTTTPTPRDFFDNKKDIPVNTNKKTATARVCIAAESGDVNKLRKLLSSGFDVNEHEPQQGYTPLHLASGEGHILATQFLIQAGARPDLTDWDGNTPLHLAAAQGNNGIIDLLVKTNANFNAQNEDGCTPLHLAAMERHKATVQILLNLGALVDVADKDFRTALHMAVFWTSDENSEIVRLLLAYNANPLWKDYYGKTPLARAESNEFEKSFRLLKLAAAKKEKGKKNKSKGRKKSR